jgi:outer membrane protein OmpA-like peptidoglycan-associated protein
LSQDRANAVKRYLSAGGVAEVRMTAVGYGQELPIADNATPAGKAKNRRVDFKLSY